MISFRITNADPAMVTQQLGELKQKELIAEMEDGKKVVRHVLADDKTGWFVLWLHCFEDHGLIPRYVRPM